MLRVLLLIVAPWGFLSTWMTAGLDPAARWIGRLVLGLTVVTYATLVYARRRREAQLRRLRPPR